MKVKQHGTLPHPPRHPVHEARHRAQRDLGHHLRRCRHLPGDPGPEPVGGIHRWHRHGGGLRAAGRPRRRAPGGGVARLCRGTGAELWVRPRRAAAPAGAGGQELGATE